MTLVALSMLVLIPVASSETVYLRVVNDTLGNWNGNCAQACTSENPCTIAKNQNVLTAANGTGGCSVALLKDESRTIANIGGEWDFSHLSQPLRLDISDFNDYTFFFHYMKIKLSTPMELVSSKLLSVKATTDVPLSLQVVPQAELYQWTNRDTVFTHLEGQNPQDVQLDITTTGVVPLLRARFGHYQLSSSGSIPGFSFSGLADHAEVVFDSSDASSAGPLIQTSTMLSATLTLNSGAISHSLKTNYLFALGGETTAKVVVAKTPLNGAFLHP